jgi:hypothetical protein
MAQGRKDRPAVEVREHHVENDKVVGSSSGQMQAIVARSGEIDDEAVLHQPFAEETGDLLFIFDNKRSHHTSPPLARTSLRAGRWPDLSPGSTHK